VEKIAFFPKNFIFSKIHQYFSNFLRRILSVSFDAKFYVDYFVFERLKRKVDSFTVTYKKGVKIEF